MPIISNAREITAVLTLLAGLLAIAAPAAGAAAPGTGAGTPASGAAAKAKAGKAARAAESPDAPGTAEIVALPNPASPLVAIRLLFRAGSIDDPAGKEGLAALTSLMVARASSTKRTYSQLLSDLYPLAASIDSDCDREVTVFSGTVPRAALAAYTRLLEEALLSPAFTDSDFKRNKQQLLAYLTDTLRSGNDELLGLEALQDRIFAGHPYGHPPTGTAQGLGAITLDDVRAFYREHYTRANLMIGVAGGYPQGPQGPQGAPGKGGYVAQLTRALAALPAGTRRAAELPPPPPVQGRRLTLIDKETASVGITLGYPLPLTRRDPDYYPLLVANSYLGEHRTFSGKLMVELRQHRGLNYGDYSYIEYWSAPPFTTHPPPNVPRREQYFSVWVRPVVPADAQFALRAALYEVDQLHSQGMSQQDFDLTRSFLINYSKLWVQDLSSRLGYHMDSRYYGMPYFIDEIESRLKQLTRDDVNNAARKYLSTDAFDAVIVTAGGEKLKDVLQRDEPSPKKYSSEVAPAVLEADKTITTLKIQPAKIEVVPVAQVFEK